MSNHTPGPWNNCGGIVFAESDGFAVAKIANEHPDQANANMRLIKASPCLLEALENIAKTCPDTVASEIAIRAITKAKGEQ